jgi:hypothetical protein
MTSLTDILLVGGTGTLGSAIRKALVANKSKFNRIGVLTSIASIEDPKKKPAFETIEKDEGLSIVVSNLDDVSALTKAMEGIQDPRVEGNQRSGANMWRLGHGDLCSCSSRCAEATSTHRCSRQRWRHPLLSQRIRL